MLIGSGGREHAIAKEIVKNKKVEKLYVLQGNSGTALVGENVDIKATDIDSIVEFARFKGVDFAVVAPDDPLVLGAVDKLTAANIACFGPNSAAAIIEGSKVFAKNLMKKYGIPTADYQVFDSLTTAREYVKTAEYPLVIKADGLALGKGVVIVNNLSQALDTLDNFMEKKVFGLSGSKVVIEEFLEGEEISLLTFCDGKTVVPMVSSMDHKRAKDGDKGLNTGGMGAVAPNPFYTSQIEKEVLEKIVYPTVSALEKEGRSFSGCLYFGLMSTKKGVKVIEYNCRFGDPETQAVLPLLKTDLLDIFLAVSQGKLDQIKVEFSNQYCCCVVLASAGYPEKYQKGYKIDIPQGILPQVYFAGTTGKGEYITNGGRVLNVYATADSLNSAISTAYEYADKIQFDNKYYRKDIGTRAKKATAKYNGQF